MEYKDFDFKVKKFETKQEEGDDEFFFFEGFAATYGNIDRDDDRIMPGAFSESLKSLTPVVLWQHRIGEPIGVSIQNDELATGLFVKAKTPLADTFVKGRVKPQVSIGSVRKLSIGFSATEYAYEKVEGRRWEVRNITKGILYEYSLVSIPANNEANVTGFKDYGSNVTIFKQLINKSLAQSGISREDQDKVIKVANNHIATMGEGKILKFEDVKDISNKEGFNGFLKNTGLFTRSAREHLAKFLPKQGKSDSKGIELITNFSKELKELENIIK